MAEIDALRERIAAVEAQNSRHADRLSMLEKDYAVSQKDTEHMDKRFDKLEGKIDWMGKIVGAAILGAIAKFILDGGLSNVGGG